MSSKRDNVINSSIVCRTNDWNGGNHSRTYLTLRSHSDRFRGCQTCKVYWDNIEDKLVIEHGRGVCPSEFLEDLDTLKTISEG